MEYGMFLKLAHTGNFEPNGHRCPIQIAVHIIQHDETKQFAADTEYKTIKSYEFNAIPDEEIMPCSTVYSGLTVDLIKNLNPISLENMLMGLSRIISKAINKNIYIIGWNILEETLDILWDNAKRIKNIPELTYDNNYIIDLNKLTQYIVPVSEVGAYGIDTATYYFTKNYDLVYGLQAQRNGKNFCSTEIREYLYCLSAIMEKQNITSFKDLAALLNTPHIIEEFTFGKHKGKKISEVFKYDNDYLTWLHNCKDIMDKNPSLKYTLDQLFAI